MSGRNDPCWCGSQLKWKKCHYPKLSPSKADANLKDEYYRKYQIILKTPEQIEGIRAACHLASRILDATCAMAVEGVSTEELDRYAHQLYLDAGSIPATLGYGEPPFTKTICTSLNEVICHGIPDPTKLKQGDILNIDVTAILNGYFGDCSRMVAIGQVSPDKQLVMDVSYECLMRAIANLKPGIPICQIGEVIESYANSKGCSVVNQFVAHGVGLFFHENPQLPHNRNQNKTVLVPGMTFTIEPMINAGVREAVIDSKDKWTARTKDGKPSAQWEHTILITDTGYEVLTNWVR